MKILGNRILFAWKKLRAKFSWDNSHAYRAGWGCRCASGAHFQLYHVPAALLLLPYLHVFQPSHNLWFTQSLQPCCSFLQLLLPEEPCPLWE